MKIVTAAEMREIDRASSERHGVPSITLMENAGAAVAEVAVGRFPHAERITIICGKGNNGGDGFVAARKLREAGRVVKVLLLADPSELKGDAAEMFKRMGALPWVARSAEELAAGEAKEAWQADLLIDAILGTGFHPPVTALYADARNNPSSLREVSTVLCKNPVDRITYPRPLCHRVYGHFVTQGHGQFVTQAYS